MIKESSFVSDHANALMIRKQEVILDVGQMDHNRVDFWMDNPRLGQLIDEQGSVDSDDLEKALWKKEDIENLASEIEADGGMNEAILCFYTKKSWKVVEGNRRLAAIRYLYKKSEHNQQWLNIKVALVPEDVSLSLIEKFLGDLHLKGKREWTAYNKARFLGKMVNPKISEGAQLKKIKEIAVDFKFTLPDAKKSVFTYHDIIEHGVSPDKCSHIELIHTNKEIKQFCEKATDKKKLIKAINTNKLGPGLEFRNWFPKIMKSGIKNLGRDVVDGKTKFGDAQEMVRDIGGHRNEPAKIKTFQEFIENTANLKKILLSLEGETFNRTKVALRKIKARSHKLYQDMKAKK